MAAADDQQPVEASPRMVRNEPFGGSVCLWGADRRVDHSAAFAEEDFVEGGCELAVAVVDQKPRRLQDAARSFGCARAGLPRPPVGLGGAARQVDAAALKLEEEKHVEAAQRERLDGEEIPGEYRGGLPAQELPPRSA